VIDVALIVPYRAREHHLACFTAWLRYAPPTERPREIVLVEASETPTTAARDAAETLDARLVNVPYDGVFHKSRMLNLGLAVTSAELVFPYDVDLVPIGDTFVRHVRVADAHRGLLFTGYRLMSRRDRVPMPVTEAIAGEATMAVEDREISHRLHLLRGYRFGISPIFERRRLTAIGGWDEEYRGWGAEDQDLIDRYLASGTHFVRSPDFVYLHLHHDATAGWNDLRYVVANRDRYNEQRRRR